MHPMTAHVAATVRAEMARRRITQARLAAAIGRTQKWVSRRLSGDVAFTIDELCDVALAIEVPVETLLSGAAA